MSHSVAPTLSRVNPATILMNSAREMWSASGCCCGRRSPSRARGALLCVPQNKGIAVDLATAAGLTRGWNHTLYVATFAPELRITHTAAGGAS